MSDKNVNRFIKTNVVSSDNIMTDNIYSTDTSCDTFTTTNFNSKNIFLNNLFLSDNINIQKNGSQAESLTVSNIGSTALQVNSGNAYVSLNSLCNDLYINDIKTTNNINSNKLTVNQQTRLNKLNSSQNALVVIQGNIGVTGNSEIKKSLNINYDRSYSLNTTLNSADGGFVVNKNKQVSVSVNSGGQNALNVIGNPGDGKYMVSVENTNSSGSAISVNSSGNAGIQVDGNMIVSGNAGITGNYICNSGRILKGNINSQGNVLINRGVTCSNLFSENTNTIQGTIQTNNQTTINGSLNINGLCTVNGSVNVSGSNSGISGNNVVLNIVGNTTNSLVFGSGNTLYFNAKLNASNSNLTTDTIISESVIAKDILIDTFSEGITSNFNDINVNNNLNAFSIKADDINANQYIKSNELYAVGNNNIIADTSNIKGECEINKNMEITNLYMSEMNFETNTPDYVCHTLGDVTSLNGVTTNNYIILYGGITFSKNVDLTGKNVTADKIFGTLTNPNQTNINSIGTLNSLNVTGGITSGTFVIDNTLPSIYFSNSTSNGIQLNGNTLFFNTDGVTQMKFEDQKNVITGYISCSSSGYTFSNDYNIVLDNVNKKMQFKKGNTSYIDISGTTTEINKKFVRVNDLIINDELKLSSYSFTTTFRNYSYHFICNNIDSYLNAIFDNYNNYYTYKGGNHNVGLKLQLLNNSYLKNTLIQTNATSETQYNLTKENVTKYIYANTDNNNITIELNPISKGVNVYIIKISPNNKVFIKPTLGISINMGFDTIRYPDTIDLFPSNGYGWFELVQYSNSEFMIYVNSTNFQMYPSQTGIVRLKNSLTITDTSNSALSVTKGLNTDNFLTTSTGSTSFQCNGIVTVDNTNDYSVYANNGITGINNIYFKGNTAKISFSNLNNGTYKRVSLNDKMDIGVTYIDTEVIFKKCTIKSRYLTPNMIINTLEKGSTTNLQFKGQTTTNSIGYDGNNYITFNIGSTSVAKIDGFTFDVNGTVTCKQFNSTGLTGTIRTTSQNFTEVGNLNSLTSAGTTCDGDILVSGNVTSINIEGKLGTTIQPNITLLGTLSSLSVNGNINSNNNVTLNIQNANVVVSNLSGNVSSSNSNQTNITSVGTLNNLTVNATNGITLSNTSSITIQNNSSYLESPFLNANLTTTNQPNITRLGNLTSLNVNGGVTIGSSGNTFQVSVGNTIRANEIDAKVISAQQPNIRILGALQGVSVENNVNISGNLFVTKSVSVPGSGNIKCKNIQGLIKNEQQTNITSVGTLSTLSVNGDVTVNNSIAVSNGKTLTAPFIDGILNTQSQPNITSVGLLSELISGSSLSFTSDGTLTKPQITKLNGVNMPCGININTNNIEFITQNTQIVDIRGQTTQMNNSLINNDTECKKIIFTNQLGTNSDPLITCYSNNTSTGTGINLKDNEIQFVVETNEVAKVTTNSFEIVNKLNVGNITISDGTTTNTMYPTISSYKDSSSPPDTGININDGKTNVRNGWVEYVCNGHTVLNVLQPASTTVAGTPFVGFTVSHLITPSSNEIISYDIFKWRNPSGNYNKISLYNLDDRITNYRTVSIVESSVTNTYTTGYSTSNTTCCGIFINNKEIIKATQLNVRQHDNYPNNITITGITFSGITGYSSSVLYDANSQYNIRFYNGIQYNVPIIANKGYYLNNKTNWTNSQGGNLSYGTYWGFQSSDWYREGHWPDGFHLGIFDKWASQVRSNGIYWNSPNPQYVSPTEMTYDLDMGFQMQHTILLGFHKDEIIHPGVRVAQLEFCSQTNNNINIDVDSKDMPEYVCDTGLSNVTIRLKNVIPGYYTCIMKSKTTNSVIIDVATNNMTLIDGSNTYTSNVTYFTGTYGSLTIYQLTSSLWMVQKKYASTNAVTF